VAGRVLGIGRQNLFLLSDQWVPVAWALLTQKTQALYEDVFRVLKKLLITASV
jgi:hypothetical protein